MNEEKYRELMATLSDIMGTVRTHDTRLDALEGKPTIPLFNPLPNSIIRRSEEYRRLHKALWYWLAETGSVHKTHWPLWHQYPDVTPDDSYCFACTQARMMRQYHFPNHLKYYKSICDYCPIEWETSNPNQLAVPCCKQGSLFHSWAHEQQIERRQFYARAIADSHWTIKLYKTT